MSITLFIFFIGILLLGGLVLWYIVTHTQGSRAFNQEKYRSDWLTIEKQLVANNESSYHLSILNADKLLDKALKEAGYKGATMGDRMKAAKDTWTNANHVWTAHKLRNQIAHETNVKISYETAKRALLAFKQALKDVGAI